MANEGDVRIKTRLELEGLNRDLKGAEKDIQKFSNLFKNAEINVRALEIQMARLTEQLKSSTDKAEKSDISKKISRVETLLNRATARAESLKYSMNESKDMAALFAQEISKIQERQSFDDIDAAIERMIEHQKEAADGAGVIKERVVQISESSGLYDNISNEIDNFGNKLEEAGAKSQNLDNINTSQTKTVIFLTREFVRLSDGIKSAFGHAIKSSGKFIGNLLGIGRGLKHSRSQSILFGDSLGQLAKRLISLAVTAVVFNQIRKALRQYISYMNDAMNTNVDFVASLALLKGSALTAFQPIYEAILPALTTFIQVLAQALQYLSAFTAMLFGTSVEAMQKNAKALWNNVQATKALGKSSKDTEKAMGQLPFDELAVLQAETDKTAGGGADIIAPDFDWEPPDLSWMDTFIDKLKIIHLETDKPFWEGIGQEVAIWVSFKLQEIPWEDIQNSAQNIGSNLGAAISGFLSSPELWNSIGTTLGNAVNTGVIFAQSFINPVDTYRIGQSVGDGIISFFKTFNEESFGSTLGDYVNKFFSFFRGLFDNMNTDDGWTLVGQKISGTINSFFTTVDFATAGKTVSDGIMGILNTIITVINKTDWDLIGNSIRDFLINIDWIDIFTSVFKIIGSSIKIASDILWKIFTELPFRVQFGLVFMGAISLLTGAITTLLPLFSQLQSASVLLGIPLGELISKIGGFALKGLEVTGGIAIIITGLTTMAKNITDLIFKWDDMDAKQKLIKVGFAVLGAAAIALGTAIALGISIATLGIGAIVAAISVAVIAVIAFIARLATEKDQILSVEQANNNLVDAKKNLVDATNNNVSAIERQEEAEKRLEAANAKSTITGENLYKMVKDGTLTYKDMDAAQREAYKAYIDNDNAQKALTESTIALDKAKQDETKAHWDNELALAAQENDYESYKNKVLETWDGTKMGADEARDRIEKAMSRMSRSAQQTFVKDLPADIANGLNPSKYETMGQRLSKWFADRWEDYKRPYIYVGKWFGDRFKEASDNIIEKFGEVKNNAFNLWEDIKNKFGEIGTTIANVIGDNFKLVVNKIIDFAENTINKFINSINNVVALVNNIPGISISKMPTLNIPRLADGGIINSATIAMIGERGREAVVPLSQNAEWMEPFRKMQEEQSRTNYLLELLIDVLNEKNMSVSLDGQIIGTSVERWQQQRGTMVTSPAFANAY